MNPFGRHPSDARLLQWLDTGSPDKVAEHVETCERCAERLEHLDRQGEAHGGAMLGDALVSLLSVPSGLGERVLRGVEQRGRAERELALFAGLMGLAVETGKLVVAPDEPDTRPRPHRDPNPGTHTERDPE